MKECRVRAIRIKAVYQDGKLHCENGPAIEYSDGFKSWFQNGLLHREDGPAVELHDGDRYWFIKGNRLTEQEFINKDKIEIDVDGVKMFISKESARALREVLDRNL